MNPGKALGALALALGLVTAQGAAQAKNTGLIFISNEKSSTITVLDQNDQVIESFETCARPRGMHFNHDRTQFFVGCADDSQIAIYDVETRQLVGRIRGVEEPETFDAANAAH